MIISSYDDIFDESFSSAFAYTSQSYAEAMAMRPAVSYIPYAAYSREQTVNIITFAHFDEGGLLSALSRVSDNKPPSSKCANVIILPVCSLEDVE